MMQLHPAFFCVKHPDHGKETHQHFSDHADHRDLHGTGMHVIRI